MSEFVQSHLQAREGDVLRSSLIAGALGAGAGMLLGRDPLRWGLVTAGAVFGINVLTGAAYWVGVERGAPRIGYDGMMRRPMMRGRMGMPGRPAGPRMRNCFANVDVFGAVQDRHTCYPTKADANNRTNGFPYPSCLPGGQIPDNQGGNNIPVPVDACPEDQPAAGASPGPAATGWGHYVGYPYW